MHGLRCKGLILALLLALATPAFCLEWYQAYQKGQGAIKKGNCASGKTLMLEALKKHPGDDLKAVPYGTFLLEYIPHFYLFQCAITEEDYNAAAQYMKDAEAGGVYSSSKAAEFRQLKTRMPQPKTTQPEVIPQQKPPVVNTTPPTTTQPPQQTGQQEKQAQVVQALKEARDALAAGDYDRARMAAYRVNALSPNQPEARRILQEIENRERAEQQAREKREKLGQATRALQSGDLATATSLSTELQSQHPSDTQVQALAREVQKQIENQKLHTQTDQEGATLERQVIISFYKGQYIAAIELAQQGLAKHPDSWRLHFFLGCSYASLAMMEKENDQHLGLARAAFAKARAIDGAAVLPPLISPKILRVYNNS
jgi:tetratricopeptide (TPR) repeat protein